MEDTATVFVVDSDKAICDAVRSVAHIMNLGCETFATGRDFLDARILDQPGCVVLEIRLPDTNGLEIQQRLLADGASIPIIFLTSQATLSLAVRAMRAGAVHFLEKPLREHELWDTIHEAVTLDRQRREQVNQRREYNQRILNLTAKERALLWAIADGGSKKEMADQMGICLRTFELRRSQLRKKLGLTSLVELVYFALTACDGPQAEGADSLRGTIQSLAVDRKVGPTTARSAMAIHRTNGSR
jgi:FixJ family two-component response regulator